jgi:uncharacterized membrane protein
MLAERRRILTIPAPATLAASGLTVAAAACYAWISLFRHDHFGSNAADLGIQDQTVWGYSHFRVIPNTVLGVPNLLGDHFHPVLLVLAPLYWIWASPEVLLVAQAVLLAVAGVPIFLWGAEQLGKLAGLGFQASYLIFWGVLSGVLFDFHHIAFAVPAVSAALYATLNRRNRLLWPAAAVALLTREDVSLTLLALGLYIILVQRRARLGGALVALGASWFASVIGVVMPALAGQPYQHWTYRQLGTGPVSAALHVLLHPLSSLELLFTPFHKVEVWIGLLGNWLFLPLLSPLFIVAIPSFLERFWSSLPTVWSFQFHYSLIEAPILTFAAIDTVGRVVRLRPRRGRWAPTASFTVGSLTVGSLVVGAVITFGAVRPLRELATYVSDGRAAQIQSCLDVIPPDASVSATSRLVPHLSDRRQIYGVPTKTDSQYLAIDLSTDQGYHTEAYAEYLRSLIRSSLRSGYGVACSKGVTVVLERGRSNGTLSPQMARFVRA